MVGMFPLAQLRHYQPTDIAALVAFEDSEVGGGVLSDEVGTGKTYVVIGLTLHRDNQRKYRLNLSVEVCQPKATLLLVPNSLIHSWKGKILGSPVGSTSSYTMARRRRGARTMSIIAER
jgi:SNF2 family DNA or RNA helicase